MRQESNEALVMEYRPLVRLLAQHLKRKMPRADRDDLEQAGMVGLIQAASRYRAEDGATFKTFIGHRIREAMLDSVRQGDWAPRSVTRAARDIAKAIRAIEEQEQRPAREVEIAERLGLSVEAYRRLLTETASRHVFSFEGRLKPSTSRPPTRRQKRPQRRRNSPRILRPRLPRSRNASG